MLKKVESRTRTDDAKSQLRRLAVGYTRVSTPGQGENGSGPEAQRVAIEAYSDAMSYTLIEIFEEVGSGVGERSFYNRKRLQAALDLVVRERAVLIVWDWDRLSRHDGFEKQVRKVLPDASRIICASEGMNMVAAAGAAQIAYGNKVAEKISTTTKEGMAKKSAQGAVFGNPQIATEVQPLGTLTWSKTRQDHDRAVAEVLRRLPNFLEVTRSQAAEVLNQSGLRTLHKKEWNKSRVTEPLKRARAILRAEEKAQMSADPRFGMF